MTYKTFTAHNRTRSWGANTGNQVALYGGFYSYHTAKSIRAIKQVILTERLPSKETIKRYGSDVWFIKADIKLIDQADKAIENRGDYQHVELIINGRNRQVDDAFITTSYSD